MPGTLYTYGQHFCIQGFGRAMISRHESKHLLSTPRRLELTAPPSVAPSPSQSSLVAEPCCPDVNRATVTGLLKGTVYSVTRMVCRWVEKALGASGTQIRAQLPTKEGEKSFEFDRIVETSATCQKCVLSRSRVRHLMECLRK